MVHPHPTTTELDVEDMEEELDVVDAVVLVMVEVAVVMVEAITNMTQTALITVGAMAILVHHCTQAETVAHQSQDIKAQQLSQTVCEEAISSANWLQQSLTKIMTMNEGVGACVILYLYKILF